MRASNRAKKVAARRPLVGRRRTGAVREKPATELDEPPEEGYAEFEDFSRELDALLEGLP